MENKLTFVLKRVDGKIETQELPVPPEQVAQAVRDMFLQYANMGMVKKDGNKFRLLTAKMIEEVEVEVPSIVIAQPGEVPKPPEGKSGLIV
jgi:lipoate synthase